MNKRIAWPAAVALVAVFSACATIKAEDVKVYSPAQLRQGEYETVARIWVESWRTAAWVPMYRSPEEGIADLRNKAASLNANGLTNVDCYGDSGRAYTCYGKAIRVR